MYNTEFDEGHLKCDLAAAEAEVEATMAILTDTHPQLRMEDNKLRWIFQLCWIRLKKRCGPGQADEQGYGLNTNVPRHVFEHPSLQECMRVSADLVILVNDILSYKKDLALGVEHNLISLLQEQGGTVQDAVDKIGEMINHCYKRWYRALADMPIWGEGIDREVLRFVEGCRNLALGNLYWSFKTGRYLGAEGMSVYETRALHLPTQIREYAG
ncbi:MAG: hypothetical protein Q9191_007410 [Dirinaria sp. TL-2023a]